MAGSDRRRGISLPGFVRTLLLVMAICVLGWLWKEIRPVPEVPSPEDNPTDRLRSFDSLVRDGEESVPLLLEMLADPDRKARREAVLALGRIRPPSDDVSDAVRARIDDEDASVRLYAFSAYKLICRNELELGELAIRLLADPDSSVRDEARMTLTMGSQEVVRAVIPLLSHESRGDQLFALEVLSGPKAFDLWGAALNEAVHQFVNDTDPTMRRLAVGMVVRHGACSHTDALAWLCDPDPKIQEIVLMTNGIQWHLPEAADAVPVLLQCFDLKIEAEFFKIRGHLNALKTLARPAIPDVLRLAERSDLRNRLQIIETLAKIGAEPDDLVRLSAPLLLHPNGGPPACRILMRASPEEAKRQVSLLVPQLQGGDGAVNVRVLDALGAFGKLARDAVPALVPLLSRNDLDSVCLVVATLGKIAPEAAAPVVPRLVASIDLENLDPYFYKQPPAIDALAAIGRSAREAVPKLLKILEMSNASKPKGTSTRNYLRPLVVCALARTGGDRADVVAALHKLRTHDDESAWLDAAQWLGSSDITTPSVLPALAEMRHDKNPYVRVIAVRAIVNQTADRDEAVTRLLDEFASDDPAMQMAAAIALGELGPVASSAVPALRDSLNNVANSMPKSARDSSVAYYVRLEDFYCTSVASAVRWALVRIEPPVDERKP